MSGFDVDAFYSIAQLTELIGGSDRLYRGEIAAGRLPAIFTGEWRVRGGDALEWAAERGARRHGRPVVTHAPMDGKAGRLSSSFPTKGGAT